MADISADSTNPVKEEESRAKYPEGGSTLLKSSRETLSASKLEIGILLVQNDQEEVQRIFTIVKHIIIYYLRGSYHK